jgi:S1-C subfamily serine protease
VRLTTKLLSLLCLAGGIAAAQSAPPRKDIPAIVKAANGAIVSIITSGADGKPLAQGTGFLVSTDGRIVTNYHVIEGASSAIVKLPDGAFYDVDGVVAFDKARDLAVIKAHGQNFRVVTLGNSDRVQVGEEIVAIGSPLSLESTVSSGIVSGIRTIETPNGAASQIQLPPGYEDAKPVKRPPAVSYGKYLQITAPISPGSSGGPLFNMAGEVVGITTLYLEGGENLNFAIPINDAKPLLSAGTNLQDFPVETEAAPSPPVTSPLKFMSFDKGVYTFVTGNLIIKATCGLFMGVEDDPNSTLPDDATTDQPGVCPIGLPGTVYLPFLFPGTFKVIGDATNPDDYFAAAGTYFSLQTTAISLDTFAECSSGTYCGSGHVYSTSSTMFYVISSTVSDK